MVVIAARVPEPSGAYAYWWTISPFMAYKMHNTSSVFLLTCIVLFHGLGYVIDNRDKLLVVDAHTLVRASHKIANPGPGTPRYMPTGTASP